MTSLLQRIGVRMGALGFAAVVAVGATACSDDGTSDTSDSMTTETDTGDGDGDTGDGDTDGALSYAADIQPIWDASCTNAGCHQPGGIAEFLDLSGNAYSNIVGVLSIQATDLQLVEAGSADTSYLVNKLRGTHMAAGGNGGSMPAGPSATPLPEDTILMIEEWIDGGCLP